MDTRLLAVRISALIVATLVTAFGVSPYDFVFYAGRIWP